MLVLLAGAGIWGVGSRVDWVELEPRNHDPDIVYVFAGADSGIERDPSDPQYTEDTDAVGRADVLLMVRVGADGTTSAFSVPRDIVSLGFGPPSRLALALLDGPQKLVDGFCGALGIEVDRLVIVDGAQFETIIDELGGIDVEIAEPIRDPYSSLLVDAAGAQHLDGETALALVRSRHPEVFVDNEWVPQSAEIGTNARASWSGIVFEQLQSKVSSADPMTLARVVWTSSEGVTVAGGFHPSELMQLARADLSINVLSTELLGSYLARVPSPDGRLALIDAGFDVTCDTETLYPQ